MTTNGKINYQSGFGNDFETEAEKGALPVGQNSPQKPPMGLYSEQFSGTAFTAPRHLNKRTWKYRIRPSVIHGEFDQIDVDHFESGPFDRVVTPPDQLRWGAIPFPEDERDFVDGMISIAGNGDPFSQSGIGIHIFAVTKSMADRFFMNSDGELLIVAENGGLRFETELGVIEIIPGEIAVIPRGLKFRVKLLGEKARGYVCENYGTQFRLPELGPIGSNCLANSRDFLTPVAFYEDVEGDFELVNKFGGNFFRCNIGHSPLDVVGWHGNNVPYKYDLRRFNTIGSISFDHPDPSIFTVLTSPSGEPGVANCDFVIFPDRWLVMEDTFKPPWYHRNTMSEYMGLVYGQYDAKEEGFVPGSGSLHNQMSAHGPDAEGFEKATNAPDEPMKLSDTLAFMFESRYIIRPTEFSLNHESLQKDYRSCWDGLKKNFVKD